jgi:hypothetical protein
MESFCKIALVRELKELCGLILGFIPWILFLFLAGHSLGTLETSLVICLAAAVIFGFPDLRSGFILAWGSLVFFLLCTILVVGWKNIWIAEHMDLLANVSLAIIVWATLLAGRPFALQYARRNLPRERWHDPRLLETCRIITLVWALLMSLSVGLSVYRRTPAPQATEQTYFVISLCIILSGIVFTTLYKRHKRQQQAEPKGV